MKMEHLIVGLLFLSGILFLACVGVFAQNRKLKHQLNLHKAFPRMMAGEPANDILPKTAELKPVPYPFVARPDGCPKTASHIRLSDTNPTVYRQIRGGGYEYTTLSASAWQTGLGTWKDLMKNPSIKPLQDSCGPHGPKCDCPWPASSVNIKATVAAMVERNMLTQNNGIQFEYSVGKPEPISYRSALEPLKVHEL